MEVLHLTFTAGTKAKASEMNLLSAKLDEVTEAVNGSISGSNMGVTYSDSGATIGFKQVDGTAKSVTIQAATTSQSGVCTKYDKQKINNLNWK